MNAEESKEDRGVTMVNLSLSGDDSISYTVNLRVIGMVRVFLCSMQKQTNHDHDHDHHHVHLIPLLYLLLIVYLQMCQRNCGMLLFFIMVY